MRFLSLFPVYFLLLQLIASEKFDYFLFFSERNQSYWWIKFKYLGSWRHNQCWYLKGGANILQQHQEPLLLPCFYTSCWVLLTDGLLSGLMKEDIFFQLMKYFWRVTFSEPGLFKSDEPPRRCHMSPLLLKKKRKDSSSYTELHPALFYLDTPRYHS